VIFGVAAGDSAGWIPDGCSARFGKNAQTIPAITSNARMIVIILFVSGTLFADAEAVDFIFSIFFSILDLSSSGEGGFTTISPAPVRSLLQLHF